MAERRIGLARALSKLGYCSRSQAFGLIRAGKVALNGRVRRDPETPVDELRDQITIAEKLIEAAQRVYLVMNKPRGVVTTASDEKGRDTVYSLLPTGMPWIAPVGRLDKASEGLLLFTNDSGWAARITDPESHLDKTYHVQIAPRADQTLVSRLMKGVKSDDEILKVKSSSVLREGGKNSWLEIVLDEGRNRQIRRILEGMNVEVLRLVRVAIGPLQLGTLTKAKVRPLTGEEKSKLDQVVG